LKTSYVSPGKPWNLVFASPGKFRKTVFYCLYEPCARDPRISSERLQVMMEGRRLIRLSTIHQKTRSIEMDGDWVTIGVIVSKTDPRVSSKVSVTSVVYRTVVAYHTE